MNFHRSLAALFAVSLSVTIATSARAATMAEYGILLGSDLPPPPTHPGTPAHNQGYNTWRTNFGATLPGGSAAPDRRDQKFQAPGRGR
jgi:hypothetical protein